MAGDEFGWISYEEIFDNFFISLVVLPKIKLGTTDGASKLISYQLKPS